MLRRAEGHPQVIPFLALDVAIAFGRTTTTQHDFARPRPIRHLRPFFTLPLSFTSSFARSDDYPYTPHLSRRIGKASPAGPVSNTADAIHSHRFRRIVAGRRSSDPEPPLALIPSRTPSACSEGLTGPFAFSRESSAPPTIALIRRRSGGASALEGRDEGSGAESQVLRPVGALPLLSFLSFFFSLIFHL